MWNLGNTGTKPEWRAGTPTKAFVCSTSLISEWGLTLDYTPGCSLLKETGRCRLAVLRKKSG